MGRDLPLAIACRKPRGWKLLSRFCWEQESLLRRTLHNPGELNPFFGRYWGAKPFYKAENTGIGREAAEH